MNPILLDLPVPITTPRLLLRPPSPGDGPGLNAAILETFPALHTWLPWADREPTLAESEENVRRSYASWILREDLRLSIFDRVTGEFVGGTGLHRINWRLPSFEIGYWIRSSREKQGLITESTGAVARYAFLALGAKRVEIRCNSRNERSVAVARRLSFEYEGCLRGSDAHRDPAPTATRDMLIFSRLNADGLPELDARW